MLVRRSGDPSQRGCPRREATPDRGTAQEEPERRVKLRRTAQRGTSDHATVKPREPAGRTDPDSSHRSRRFPGLVRWLNRTTLLPANVPIPAPKITSVAQWRLLY